MTFTKKEMTNIENILVELSKNIESFYDIYKLINTIPEDNEILLLGECTHGTEEFYKIRSDITKILVKEKGYRVIFLEGEWPDLYRVNQYITQQNTKDKNAKQSLNNIHKYPKWMWRNNIIVELIEWLKDFNTNQNDDEFVYLLGIDCQQIYKSLKDLFVLLEKIDLNYKNIVAKKLNFFSNFTNENEYAHSVVSGRFRRCAIQIQNLLQDLLSEYQWDKVDNYFKQVNDQVSLMDIISSEQNMAVIVNAEEYFRKMILEPPGSQASWNTRDQHMLMTIMRIRNKLESISNKIPKIIVWAHNSHIGNSEATNKGGKDFTQNNTWNLGQMVRQMFDKTHLIGFYTNSGQVSAKSKNNKVCDVYELNPASIYSYEYFFHLTSCKVNMDRFFINMKPYSNIEKKCLSSSDIMSLPIPGQYRFIHSENIVTETEDPKSDIIPCKILPGEIFTAIKRVQYGSGYIRLQIDTGGWITEYNPYGNVTLNCVLVDTIYPESIGGFLSSNLLQRWIGINYCKDSEIQSHYGESCLAHQYDVVVYVDKTNAIIPIDIPEKHLGINI